MKRLLFLLILLCPILMKAQIYLKPSIGVNSEPQDTDTICTIPIYTGSFYTSGLQAGDTAFDFKLYAVNGDSMVLSQWLSTGKPVLIVNGNYTCPVFRNKVPMINQVVSTYAGLINVVVINTVEAHPTDISPYFGFVNVGTGNTNAGILFPQPTTYLERKDMVDTMMANLTLNAPIFLDGPCNNFWSIYGPAPNNAYLIKPDGIIFAKHGWFDRNPTDYILCDIDSLLYNTPCSQGSGAGSFSIVQYDSLITGPPGNILYGYTDIINTSNTTITVSAKKIQKNYGPNWQTAFCADVCYSPLDDSITFTIPAYDTMHFSIDFITHAVPDSGDIRIGFRNVNNVSNQFPIKVKAKTLWPNQVESPTSNNTFKLYPNPANNYVQIQLSERPANEIQVTLADACGRKLSSFQITEANMQIPLDALKPGVYFLKIEGHVERIMKW